MWYPVYMTRDAIHGLVDLLPEAQLRRAGDVLRALSNGNEFSAHLALVPEDVPEPDEVAAFEDADSDPERSEFLPLEQVKAKFGIA